MKRKKITFICYLAAAICYLSIAAIHFFENVPAEGLLYLCLGGVDIALCIEHFREHISSDGQQIGMGKSKEGGKTIGSWMSCTPTNSRLLTLK